MEKPTIIGKLEKQNDFADVELGNDVDDDEKPKDPAKVNPDSKIDLVRAFFQGGINGAMTNMMLFFLAFFLIALICGLISFLASFFKVQIMYSRLKSEKNAILGSCIIGQDG